LAKRRSATPVILSLGSNLGERTLNLRRALARLSSFLNLVRVSSIYETAPLDAPSGSQAFLNLVVAALSRDLPDVLLQKIQGVEKSMRRVRRIRNAPRIIDIDLILYGAKLMKASDLVVPHPRFDQRNFVLDPLKELGMGWVDPRSGRPIDRMTGSGNVRRLGVIY
jgi:2-amino-4-hydroxy-6-hydroxymethyldihydropteridine diphosphokinase